MPHECVCVCGVCGIWHELLAAAAAAGPNNYLAAHISTRLVCGQSRPGEAFWARPIILITRTLCLLLLLMLLVLDSCLRWPRGKLPTASRQRQLQRHLLFVFIKKILQRQHEINTEAKVHARTRTRSISCSCSCKLHTHTHTQGDAPLLLFHGCLSDGGD